MPTVFTKANLASAAASGGVYSAAEYFMPAGARESVKEMAIHGGVQAGSYMGGVWSNCYILPKVIPASADDAAKKRYEMIALPLTTGGLHVGANSMLGLGEGGSMMRRFLISVGSAVAGQYIGGVWYPAAASSSAPAASAAAAASSS